LQGPRNSVIIQLGVFAKQGRIWRTRVKRESIKQARKIETLKNRRMV